ncbi:MAG: bacterioferritin-associated ferredoxin [Planctomycetales bacterium]
MQVLCRTHTEADDCESIVCHCLKVSESTLVEAIAICGAASVRELCHQTGAGGGCTACHSRLRELIREAQQAVTSY